MNVTQTEYGSHRLFFIILNFSVYLNLNTEIKITNIFPKFNLFFYKTRKTNHTNIDYRRKKKSDISNAVVYR